MAAHSSILAWRIPGAGAWWAGLWGHTELGTTDVTSQQQHVPLIIPLSLGNQWLWFGVFVLVFVAYSFLKMFIGEDSCLIMC